MGRGWCELPGSFYVSILLDVNWVSCSSSHEHLPFFWRAGRNGSESVAELPMSNLPAGDFAKDDSGEVYRNNQILRNHFLVRTDKSVHGALEQQPTIVGPSTVSIAAPQDPRDPPDVSNQLRLERLFRVDPLSSICQPVVGGRNR
jgi:hypothetical protein